MQKIKIGATSFLDYIMSTPRGCTKIVKAQRSMYNDPESQAFHGYESIKSGMKRAISSTDAEAELAAVIAKATKQMAPHYEAIATGFIAWRGRSKGTGVRARDAAWASGNLTVTLRHIIGLRQPDGSELAVLTYVKEPVLTQDSADLLLRIMDLEMGNILPGATSTVLDARRGKPFRLRRNANKPDLDAALAAEAAKYVTHWTAVA